MPGDSHIADYGEKKVDVYRLIHLAESLPEEDVSTVKFEEATSENSWRDKNGNPLSPKQMLAELTYSGEAPNWNALAQNRPAWQDEIEKIKNADYATHPIIVIEENIVIDGMHRLTRALAEKAPIIRVKRFSKLPQETIIFE